jgi:hypothetical protein
MHPEVRQPGPGKCPKCGMDLVVEGREAAVLERQKVEDFLPLIVIFLFVVILTGVATAFSVTFEVMTVMRYFEGFFFLIFGTFKLLNLKGFADAYSTYDIIAKRSRAYALVYPFIELALAACYLFSFRLLAAASVTLALMIIGSIGVAGELRKKNQIPCACLGVVFKLPMTWVTFIEDILMAVMAAVMILYLTF